MPRRWIAAHFATLQKSRTAHPVVYDVQPRYISNTKTLNAEVTPLRKKLKESSRASRPTSVFESRKDKVTDRKPSSWELTVGIEIHAQLNTSVKLFSFANAEYTETPNASSWPFDLAVPGSQPVFQPPVLIPAIRAALALNCQIQWQSKFDRKHYFYHDQPAGYQITQFYEPFARDGHITLTTQDGLSGLDDDPLRIGIKQVQLEQDTARTQEQDEFTNLIDFNRSGHALIEIISLPQLHSPEAASAYVRKVQSILYAVDAATIGMELGGFRADVNVSVRKVDDTSAQHSYAGVTGLGQRTEIKNLSSFKAVEDAVRAERDRQIQLLESGGAIEGETRGWSLSAPGITRRLRGKEGEVDYRYMPDPDISPIHIDATLVEHLKRTLPPVPQQLLDILCNTYGLPYEDAKALLSLDDGARLHYYQDVVSGLSRNCQPPKSSVQAAKWVLYELGALLTMTNTSWKPDLIDARKMADLVSLQLDSRITGTSAKQLLRLLFNGDKATVAEIVQREKLLFAPMTNEEYEELAMKVINEHSVEADIVRQGGKRSVGKLKFLLGQMMRYGDRNRLEAQKAEGVLQNQLGSTDEL